MKREKISRQPGAKWAIRWPWDDRGRSLLTREKIAQQTLEARRLYERMFPRAA